MDTLPVQVTQPSPTLPATLQAEAETAHAFARNEKSAATRRAYRGDWRLFTAWCRARSVRPLPAAPEAVATFLGSQAAQGLKAATLSRRLASIRYAHRLAGHEPPTSSEVVRATMRGIRRTIGAARLQKSPATADRLLAMLQHLPATLAGRRDRALLLLGFAGAFRRSELAALCVEDIEEVEEGLRVTVRRGKTDQEAAGQVVPIIRGARACPVQALNAWLAAADITTGPLFRPIAKGGRILPQPLTPHSIGAIVKACAARAGFDPADFGGHSLRAGFLTSAASNGASIFRMMDISRHKSVDTLRSYIRRAEEFKEHAGEGLL